jgi:predicted HicB family RNase H-like nuclease
MPETVVHFQIRTLPPLHEHLASRARDEKTSLNALIVALLRDASERREASGAAMPAS